MFTLFFYRRYRLSFTSTLLIDTVIYNTMKFLPHLDVVIFYMCYINLMYCCLKQRVVRNNPLIRKAQK